MARNTGSAERKVTKINTVTDEDVQRGRYGGFNIGAAFFGWLVATGLATLLISLLTAIGSATAFTALKDTVSVNNESVQSTQEMQNTLQANSDLADEAKTVGLISGALLLLALAIAYYAGGYVAGRMSRFDGGRQGFGAWAFGLIIAIILALAGVILGNEYNLLQQANLPRIPVDEGALTTGGIIALLLVLLVTALAAISGGKVGQRYHQKVDDTGVRT